MKDANKPRFDDMPGSASDGKQDKDRGCSHVCPAKEGVLSAYPRHGGDYDGFSAFVREDWEVCEYVNKGHLRISYKCTVYALNPTTILYRPLTIVSASFRPYSFVNVGSPAVLIQFWKCSLLRRSGGGVELVYPSGYCNIQLGGGTMSEREE